MGMEWKGDGLVVAYALVIPFSQRVILKITTDDTGWSSKAVIFIMSLCNFFL